MVVTCVMLGIPSAAFASGDGRLRAGARGAAWKAVAVGESCWNVLNRGLEMNSRSRDRRYPWWLALLITNSLRTCLKSSRWSKLSFST
jgi:hypothetical protein